MPELRNATVTVGNPGLNGTGVSAPEKTDIFNRLTALEAVTPVVNIGDLADVDLSGAATGDLLQFDGTDWVPYTPAAITVTSSVGFIIDGGGATIATGVKGEREPFAFAGNITGVSMTGDQSGSIGVQIWKDSMANFPPTVADLVTTVSLSGATRTPTSGSYTTITSIPFSVGDVLRYNVPSAVTSLQRVTIGLRIEHEVGP